MDTPIETASLLRCAHCSGLIYTDTSIGGKSTISVALNGKATKKNDISFKLEVVPMIQE
jgi:hypothetical protein